MSMTSLQKQAWQSGLVLLDETAKWNETDWPPLKGGWRSCHATVVLNHAAKDDNNDNDNHKGQTVVVMGGYDVGWRGTNSVLLLNLADLNKQWREGPPMNTSRRGHAAVVCNGGIYVMGGCNQAYLLGHLERIDVNNMLQSFSSTSSTHESHWTTLNCRLSTGRCGCCAVAVHNRYIVVMGGRAMGQDLSSVEIIDTSNHTVIARPSMNIPRSYFGSAVIGHRIFVLGGCTTNTLVDYLDFTKPCDNERNDDTLSTVISFSSAWTTHSSLVLSEPRNVCAAVAVGSCLVVAGGHSQTVEVLDTRRDRVWNLPQIRDRRRLDNMVTVANQVAVIGGWDNPSCATLKIMDKNTWCFRKLCDQAPNGWYHFWEGSGKDRVTPL